MTVETDAMNIALYANWCTGMPQIGTLADVCTQTNAQSAAKNSSTIIPAAPTNIRAHRLGNAQAVEASTYGVGTSTSSMIPSSWHSPPNRRQANAWPSSRISLMKTKVTNSSSQLLGSITLP